MNPKLKHSIFATESIAHLRGHEREILPVIDSIRMMHDAIKAHLNPFVDRQKAHEMLLDAVNCEGIKFE